MRRVSWASRVWRASRSKTFGKVVGASAAGALIIAAAAAGTTEAVAAPPDQHSMVDNALYPQTVPGGSVSPSNDQLSVTVGKAVSITTDPAGIPNLKALVTNTQVSGQGSGKLYVPVGTSSPSNSSGFESLQTDGDSIVYNIDSKGGQVQNLKASGGTYQGQEAVTLKVEAWLNGQPIDPAKMFDITGDVKINYTFTNMTSKRQTVTYKNTNGQMATATVNIPVPMGASFSTTFGDGWGNINAPWADTGISPSGQQLNGTAILFPPIGGITQTLTVTARAQNATLPRSTTTAIPINLGTYSGGLILNILPQVSDVANVGAGLVGKLPSQLVFFQQLLGKFGEIIADINTKYVKPLTDDLVGVKINPKKIDSQLSSAADSTDFAAKVLGQDADLDQLNSKLISSIATLLKTSNVPLNNLQTEIDNIADSLKKLLPTIKQMSNILGNKEDLDQVANDLPTIDKACEKALAVNTLMDNGGTAALDSAISAAPIFSNQRAQLQNIRAYLNGNINPLAGPLIINGQNEFPQKQLIGGGKIPWLNIPVPGCAQVWDTVDPLLTALPTVKKTLDELYLALAFGIIQDMIKGETAKIVNELIPALQSVGNALDNKNCPTTLAGIMALYKSKGVKGILSSCGLAQASNALAFVNSAVSKALSTQVAPGLRKLKKFVPTLYKYDQLVQKYAPELEAGVNSVPGLLDSYAKLLGGFMPTIQTLDGTVVSAADQISILNSSMVAMNDRALSGAGAPYGNATGVGNPTTLAAWQINQAGAVPGNSGHDVLNLGIALLLFLIGAGVGTTLYLRRPH